MVRNGKAGRFALKKLPCILLAAIALLALAACAPNYDVQLPESPFAGRQTADLSGYDTMAGTGAAESRLVETDVDETLQLMDTGSSFVLFAGYEQCPYCNRLLPYLNDAAAKFNTYVGYIDTRKNPDWKSNVDIDDYDRFAERFADWIAEDDDGTAHLYVPEIFYIKDGQVATAHEGVVEGADDPEVELTEQQSADLEKALAADFAKIA